MKELTTEGHSLYCVFGESSFIIPKPMIHIKNVSYVSLTVLENKLFFPTIGILYHVKHNKLLYIFKIYMNDIYILSTL